MQSVSNALLNNYTSPGPLALRPTHETANCEKKVFIPGNI